MNKRQRRIARRRDQMYRWFQNHTDEYISLRDLCKKLGCHAGKTSRAAIRKVRDLARADGWYFPPAVPATRAQYVLSKDPSKLLDPALHLGRIRTGVERSENELLDEIRERRHELDPEIRAVASARLAAHDFLREQREAASKFVDTVTKDLVAQRREERTSEVEQ